MVQILKRPVLLLCLLVAAASSMAQTGRDPTQPPRGYYAPPEGLGAEPEETEEAPAVQVIMRPHAARPLAVITGEAVALGARGAGGRLVRVEETRVYLQGTTGQGKLELIPGVSKRRTAERGTAGYTENKHP